jgi:hypothetical protein
VTRQKLVLLAIAAAVVLGGAIWLSAHRSSQQGMGNDGPLLPDLKAKLGDVTQIRMSKGDGSAVTLKRTDSGWTVVERNYPADAQRVRELALNLSALEVLERKTSDPANYPKLGVEAPDTPAASGTLVEVVAGEKTWSLIVGKPAQGRAVYVRLPKEAGSALAQPLLMVDPDQKRWLDRQIVDVPGADVRDIAITPSKGAAYTLAKQQATDREFTIAPVPKGRASASSFALNGQADALTAFTFDDVHALPDPAPPATDRAVYRTFDGRVIEFHGRRVDNKAYVTIVARRDAAPKKDEKSVERLVARAKGVEFEIPGYKYDSIFKSQEELLEPKR